MSYQEVVYFKWKEYHGFIPVCNAIVIAETEDECLIKIGWFKKVWTLKYTYNVDKQVAQKCGYVKRIKSL